jgi:3'-5' exoribonuclease
VNDQASFPGTTDARCAIIELESGQSVNGAYACSEKTTATDRNGKAYLRLKLRDASGEVAAIHFDPSEEALEICAGDVVVVGGTYSVHPQYGAQVQVRRLRAAENDEYDPSDLVPVSPVGAAELAERLHALIDSVEEPHVRALLERAFDGGREPGATFLVAPAAVRNHHAYRHGLLEHSLVVAEAAGGVASRFPQVDRDLTVAGGLLHDIGKTLAYTSDGVAPQMTDAGRLHGEIVMGHDMVRDLIDEDPDFPSESALRLRHIIVAHHGMREKGSPVVPQTREAIIVHYCDDMTARIAAVDDAEAATRAGERWTNRIFMIDAPAYLGPGEGTDET